MNKNIIKIILVLLVIISSKVISQTLNLNPGANNPNPNLDKYIGTWKWEANGKTFIWVIKKQNIPIPPFDRNITADIIYGFHKYTEGGAVIENSLDFSNTIFEDKKSTIFGGMGLNGNANFLKGSIEHISKNKKDIDFKIEYIDSTHIKLVSLKNGEGIRFTFPGQAPFDWSISLPQDIILTKQ